MTITLPTDLESRLREAASRQGTDAATLARRLIEQALAAPPPPVPSTPGVPTDQATLELLDQWERQDATTDPAELARRAREFEAFKEAMNRNRLDAEGPDARKVYP